MIRPNDEVYMRLDTEKKENNIFHWLKRIACKKLSLYD